MKKLLIVLALSLTACAPALKAVQGEAGTLTRGTGEQIVLTNPGPSVMKAPTVRLEGPGLVMDVKYCAQAGTDAARHTAVWHCGYDAAHALPDVPVGGFSSVTPTAGHVQLGSATFYRDGHFLPVRLELQ